MPVANFPIKPNTTLKYEIQTAPDPIIIMLLNVSGEMQTEALMKVVNEGLIWKVINPLS